MRMTDWQEGCRTVKHKLEKFHLEKLFLRTTVAGERGGGDAEGFCMAKRVAGLLSHRRNKAPEILPRTDSGRIHATWVH